MINVSSLPPAGKVIAYIILAVFALIVLGVAIVGAINEERYKDDAGKTSN